MSIFRWLRHREKIKALPSARLLRKAAQAWAHEADVADRNGGVHPKGEVFFAHQVDQKLLEAAIAFAVDAWKELRPHTDVAYGLRLLWKIAVPDDPLINLPPARGRARTKQQASLGAVGDWIKSLPKRVVPEKVEL